MKNNIIKTGLALTILMLFSTACDKTLDINQNPNRATSSTTALTLPVAQASVAYMINLDLGIMTGYLNQYWTQAFQAAQYQTYDNYTYNGGQTQTAWLHAYAWALEDLNFVRNQAIADGTANYEAIALILSAYVYQVNVDVWDKIPYSEALQGKEGNLQPSYDEGSVVYDGIIQDIDLALSKIDPGSITPGNDDFLFGGDMEAWVRFANTLKLRIYLRQSSARPNVAQAGIQQMYANGAQFMGSAEHAMVSYPGTAFNENPLWSGDVSPNGLGGVNINGSATIIDAFNNAGDPRVDFYFDAAVSGTLSGQQVGIEQGAGVLQGGNSPIGDNSVPSSINVVATTSPVYFITGFESILLQAEAVARGWGTGSTVALYDAGVQAAFDFTGNSAAAALLLAAGGAYEFPNGTVDVNVEAIARQKWLAMCGIQNVESWAETRRQGYFDFDQSVSGTGASLNGSLFPERALYPTTEISTNPNAEPNGNIGDKVWWNK